MSTFQRLIESQLPLPEQQRERVEIIEKIERLTQRPLIVYAADWLTPSKQRIQGLAAYVGLDYNDVLPFRELIAAIEGSQVDVLIQSPGGLGEAAERLVDLLRGRFNDVRFFVPHSAMSAATMLCFSGNYIAMGETSALGPIDPQVNGVPARAIKKGFERVRKAVGKTPGALAPYLPMLQKYDLHVLEVCDNAEKLSKKLAREWLKKYMFYGDRASPRKVNAIVQFFASHDKHLSHSRSVGVEECAQRGLRIFDLRKERELGTLVWDLWEHIEFFFGSVNPAVKLFENSRGVSFMRMAPQEAVFQLGAPLPFPISAPPQPPPDTNEGRKGAAAGP